MQIKMCCSCSSHKGQKVQRIQKLISCFASVWPRPRSLLLTPAATIYQATRAEEVFPSA